MLSVNGGTGEWVSGRPRSKYHLAQLITPSEQGCHSLLPGPARSMVKPVSFPGWMGRREASDSKASDGELASCGAQLAQPQLVELSPEVPSSCAARMRPRESRPLVGGTPTWARGSLLVALDSAEGVSSACPGGLARAKRETEAEAAEDVVQPSDSWLHVKSPEFWSRLLPLLLLRP